eukprot:Rmarinus@m.2077
MPLKSMEEAQAACEALGDNFENDVVVMSTLVVLHELKDDDWVAHEDSWSTVNLLKNSSAQIYRVSIQNADGSKVLVNTPLYDGLTYIEHTPDFHCWTLPNDETVGLMFLDCDVAAKFSREIDRALKETLEDEPSAASYPKYGDVPEEILQKRRECSRNNQGRPSISTATNFEHITHVVSSGDGGQLHNLEGLPQEWREALLPDQFGVALSDAETEPVEGYASPIPKILVQMRDYLFSHGGTETVGVFRLAPDEDECRSVKYQLNKAKFESCADVNCIANLIKVWFRELPENILSCLPKEKIAAASESENDSYALLEGLPEPNRSIMFFLLDLITDISKNEAVNKMGPRNMAIVFAPNLYSAPKDMDPFYALQLSQQVAQFFCKCVIKHMHNRGIDYQEFQQ